MRKEIDKAVETFHRIAFGTGKNGRKIVNDNQLASFVTVLTELLLLRFKNNWYPENPNRGSGYRCLRINSQCMDPTILDSLIKSEISVNKELRRMELTIWVDPGVVSIRIGEEGSIGTEDVETDSPLTRKDSTSEDEAYSSRSPSPISMEQGPSTPRKSPPPSPTHPSPQSSVYNISPKIHQRGVVYHQHVSPPSSVRSSSPTNASLRPSPPLAPVYHNQTHHRIPSPSQDLTAADVSPSGSRIPSPHYSRPKALFPSKNSNGNVNGNFQNYYKEGMMAAHQSHHAAMAMHMARNVMPQSSYMDIPAQA